MDEQNRPSIFRFLIYLIAAAGLAGGLAGWINASGAMSWAESLTAPNWSVGSEINVITGMLILQPVAIALWISQRSGRDGMRLISTLIILGILAALIAQLMFFFGTRNVELGFLAHLAGGIYMLFAIGLVGRCSRPAGYLLWPLFIWQVYHIALMFEFMRLNGDQAIANLALFNL